MTQKQQELYDKLLKKVNEYCLGAAAEDVIESIDALVESYEKPKVDTTSTPLQAFRNGFCMREQKNEEVIYRYRFTNEDINIIEKSLEALEIIKDKVAPLVNLDTIDIGDGSNKLKYRVYDNELYAYRPLTEEEYELLKEVLK